MELGGKRWILVAVLFIFAVQPHHFEAGHDKQFLFLLFPGCNCFSDSKANLLGGLDICPAL